MDLSIIIVNYKTLELTANCLDSIYESNMGDLEYEVIVVDNAYWAYYMASLQAIQRFTSSGDANLGFVTVKFMDADVVLDGGIGGFCPTKTMFMLNTKYLFWRPHSARNMVPLSPGQRYSVNQDAAVQILAWAGNLCASGLQFQGRMVE